MESELELRLASDIDYCKKYIEMDTVHGSKSQEEKKKIRE